MKIGILGGGQLAQMLMLAGHELGIEVNAFDQVSDPCARIVGPVTQGDITDSDKLHRWASHVDLITYEFENFPAELIADLSEVRTVLPPTAALASTQDRVHEKRLLDQLEVPVTPFRVARSVSDIAKAFDELEGPLVIKSRTGGYDGKSQVVLKQPPSLQSTHKSEWVAVDDLVRQGEVIVEQWVSFSAEISVIGVRGRDDFIAVYPATENEHRQGLLHASLAPARIPAETAALATRYVTAVLKHFAYVGVLALELFVVDGRLLANEIAPRVHNTGHWTIEGAETSQFENHLRAIAGLPLGSVEMMCPTAMVNIIGEMPSPRGVLAIPGAHLHVYGKTPRPGRKLGHITVTAKTDAQLRERLLAVENVLTTRLK